MGGREHTERSQLNHSLYPILEEYRQDEDLMPKGVKYVYIPVKDENAPTAEQAKQFVDVISNPDNWPVLVHCKGGEGRAGVFSAVVRHSFDVPAPSKRIQRTRTTASCKTTTNVCNMPRTKMVRNFRS